MTERREKWNLRRYWFRARSYLVRPTSLIICLMQKSASKGPSIAWMTRRWAIGCHRYPRSEQTPCSHAAQRAPALTAILPLILIEVMHPQLSAISSQSWTWVRRAVSGRAWVLLHLVLNDACQSCQEKIQIQAQSQTMPLLNEQKQMHLQRRRTLAALQEDNSITDSLKSVWDNRKSKSTSRSKKIKIGY